MERLSAVVEGMVQGVGFRQYTLRRAQRLGLTGWVKNRHDRKVEVLAEGPRNSLEQLLQQLHEGPPASMVRDVHATWEQATGEFIDFHVA
jgi:acylphosphatase